MDYPLIFRNRHALIELDNRMFLIDTGSPLSFGNTGTVKIDNHTFNLQEDYFGINPIKLSGWIGFELSGLIGNDILSNFNFDFNWVNSVVRITHDEIVLDGLVKDIEALMSVPVMSLQINDYNTKAFIDTGAPYSYLKGDLLNRNQPAGEVTDFYPSIGQFILNSYRTQFTIDKYKIEDLACEIPSQLSLVLSITGVNAILGLNVLQHFRFKYSPRLSKISLNPTVNNL